MPRHPRPVIPEIPLHIIQRGNNRQTCFFEPTDFMVYLDLLGIASRESGCPVHAYVLMTNHVHLLLTPGDERGPAAMMKSVGERYVRYVNRRYTRTGTLWEGRYRSCLVQSERYLMVCYRYIELNPVRACMVADPQQYLWSSYRCNAHGEHNGLVTPHELYSQLGNDTASRQFAYRALFNDLLSDETLKTLRQASHGGFVLGNLDFADYVTGLLQPKPLKPGSDQLV
jgi:putative transposase